MLHSIPSVSLAQASFNINRDVSLYKSHKSMTVSDVILNIFIIIAIILGPVLAIQVQVYLEHRREVKKGDIPFSIN